MKTISESGFKYRLDLLLLQPIHLLHSFLMICVCLRTEYHTVCAYLPQPGMTFDEKARFFCVLHSRSPSGKKLRTIIKIHDGVCNRL